MYITVCTAKQFLKLIFLRGIHKTLVLEFNNCSKAIGAKLHPPHEVKYI